MQITSEGLEKLKKELALLKKKRLEISKRIQSAKELGDLSENAEYSEAKDAQRINESRITEIEEQIRSATIVENLGIKDYVQIGSIVEVSSEKNGKQTFKIVGANESEPSKGHISTESPLGDAFSGRRKGDTVEVKLPTKKSVYRILKVS